MWLFYNDTSESMIRHSREKNRYLRLEGIVPHHKIPPPGKQMGRTQSEYNEATHFNKKELKKMKIICTPLTSEAMALLDLDDCPDSLLESISLSHEECEKLLESGALEAINETLGKIIDDYEDEAIYTTDELSKTLAILKDHLTREKSSIIKN